MKKNLVIVLALVLCLAALAGCGGSQQSSGNASPTANSASERAEPSTAPAAAAELLSAAELLEVYETLNASDGSYKEMTYEEFRDTYMHGVEGELFHEDDEHITYKWTSAEDDLRYFSLIIDKSTGKCKLYAVNALS